MSVPENPELPAPSPELVLILALVAAHVETMPVKRRDRFLLAVSRALEMHEGAYNIVRFRPKERDKDVRGAMTRARAWWRYAIGVVARE